MRKLTGRYYFKQTILGLVLMVQLQTPLKGFENYSYKWEKGKPEDIEEIFK